MGNSKKKLEEKKRASFWDFLIAFGSGAVNLLKAEKIVCIIVLYLIGRDFYFTANFDKGVEYQKQLIDPNVILNIINSSDNLTIIFACTTCLAIAIILILILVIRFVYVKEIDRLAEERGRIMHDVVSGNFKPLEKHNSSTIKGWEG